MADIQPTDTLSGILGAIQPPITPDLTGVPVGGVLPQSAPPTSPGELDSYLQSWQNQTLNSLQEDWSNYFEEEGAGQMQQIQEQIMPEETLPKPPDYAEILRQGREEWGLDQMEQDLIELKRMEREQQAIRRERISGTYEERTRMSAIQGQVGEIERQEMQRIDAINREIAYKTDSINTAYNIINSMINISRMGWQDAKEWWQTQFNANMSIYQQLRGEYESDRAFAQQQIEYQQSVAKANLQIYTDMISKGQLTWDQIDEATKTQITKLEIQSGLGAGFLSKVKIDPDIQIKAISNRDVGGIRYADVLKYNPQTKALEVETIKIGKVSSSGGGGGGTPTVRNSYGYTEKEWKSKIADARSYLVQLEKDYEKQMKEKGWETGTGAYEGDKILADWEIRNAARDFTAKYGEAGPELLYEALKSGGYKTWDFKNNKEAPLSILGID